MQGKSVKEEPSETVELLENKDNTPMSGNPQLDTKTKPEDDLRAEFKYEDLDDAKPCVKKEVTDHLIPKTGKMEEHKIKIKKEEGILRLNDNAVNQRLAANGVQPLEIMLDRDFLDRAFTRQHISKVYGGQIIQVFATVRGDNVRDGVSQYSNWKPLWNPHVPQNPGACGLVITKKYMGVYEIKEAKAISLEEWIEMPRKTKEIWYEQEIGFLNSDSGRNVRNKILARKIALGGTRSIQREDIDEAIGNGDVVLPCYTVKCALYDERIQRTLIEREDNKKKKTREDGGKKQTQKGRQKSALSETRRAKSSAVKKGESTSGGEWQLSNVSQSSPKKRASRKREASEDLKSELESGGSETSVGTNSQRVSKKRARMV